MPSGSRGIASEGLDAVCVDGFGTLVVLEDPAERLAQALAERGIERSVGAARAAFRAEAGYYRPRSLAGRDGQSLATLRRDCVRVFLEHLNASLPPEEFVPAFMEAIVFHLADGALEALERLRAAGLALACVANWDVSLHDHLRRLGVHDRFELVLSSAEAGAEKPDPRIFRIALGRLGVEALRAVHVGDEPNDRDGALAAGLTFLPAPLATVPERIGL
jgi:HAD superfamily hydrolase (TIGR01509 family)